MAWLRSKPVSLKECGGGSVFTVQATWGQYELDTSRLNLYPCFLCLLPQDQAQYFVIITIFSLSPESAACEVALLYSVF